MIESHFNPPSRKWSDKHFPPFRFPTHARFASHSLIPNPVAYFQGHGPLPVPPAHSPQQPRADAHGRGPAHADREGAPGRHGRSDPPQIAPAHAVRPADLPGRLRVQVPRGDGAALRRRGPATDAAARRVGLPGPRGQAAAGGEREAAALSRHVHKVWFLLFVCLFFFSLFFFRGREGLSVVSLGISVFGLERSCRRLFF